MKINRAALPKVSLKKALRQGKLPKQQDVLLVFS